MRHRLFFARTNGFQVDTTTIYDFTVAGSGSVTIPIGAKTLIAEVWAGGGGGGKGRSVGMNDFNGGGGGSGSYAKKTLNVSGYERFTINYSVGSAGTGNSATLPATSGGSSTLTSGTFSFTSIITNGGGAATPLAGGSAGTVGTGGDTNTAGNAGNASGVGGLGVVGDNIFTFDAGTISISGTNGQFTYSGQPLAFTLATDTYIRVSGTNSGTGTITGYTNPKTYIITATNGTTTFTLGDPQTGVLVTTAGTTTGLTFAGIGLGGDGGEGGFGAADPGVAGKPGRIRLRFSAL